MSYRDRPKEVSQEFNKKYYAKSAKNSFKSKSRFSSNELLLIWQHGVTDTELSKSIGRSVKAIQIARSRIKSGIIKTDWKK
jgi:hypothetical protein